MKKLILAVGLLALMLEGCAHRQTVWVHSNPAQSEEEFNRDKAYCQMQVKMGTAGAEANYYQGSGNILAGAYSITTSQNQIYMLCMRSKGYTLQDKEEFERSKLQETESKDMRENEPGSENWRKIKKGVKVRDKGTKMEGIISERDGTRFTVKFVNVMETYSIKAFDSKFEIIE